MLIHFVFGIWCQATPTIKKRGYLTFQEMNELLKAKWPAGHTKFTLALKRNSTSIKKSIIEILEIFSFSFWPEEMGLLELDGSTRQSTSEWQVSYHLQSNNKIQVGNRLICFGIFFSRQSLAYVHGITFVKSFKKVGQMRYKCWKVMSCGSYNDFFSSPYLSLARQKCFEDWAEWESTDIRFKIIKSKFFMGVGEGKNQINQ